MNRMTPIFFLPLFFGLSFAGEAPKKVSAKQEIRLETALEGDVLSVNGQPTQLGAAQWREPERSWRTVGELIKTALPPADAQGSRPQTVLSVTLDDQASWGALKTLLMAAAGLGVPQASVQTSARKEPVTVALPGADAGEGLIVPLPLKIAANGLFCVVNRGRELECTSDLLRGLVKQQPKAVIELGAEPSLPANKVVVVIHQLRDLGAAGVAFLPVRKISAADVADQKEAKDAVERAFKGGLGGLGGGK